MKLMILFSVMTLIGLLSVDNTKLVSASGECAMEGCEQNVEGKAKKQEGEAFFCNLGALTKEQRQRHIELGKQMHTAIQEVKELPDGYALRFASDAKMLLSLAEFVSYERLCCPFFKFTMEIESSDKPMWLRITGRDGVKAFLKTAFGIK